jgi:1-acyl-sn-glycerol-3-phosphate acyltransferase
MSTESNNPVPQLLDINKIFYSKNPKLAKHIPGFVYNYIKRIIHQDFLNNILIKHGNKYGVEFADACIGEFNVHVIVKGEENIPSGGRNIFAGNHPLGGFDGIILIHVLGKHYPEIKFMVNDILMNITNLLPVFVPINKHGAHSKSAATKIEGAFNSNSQILTFPSGLVSRRIKGRITDLDWKTNFIKKSIQHQRDVVPVHFNGGNSNFFYNFANLRKFLGIKSNIEMFYLVDETYKHHNQTITVTFGKPIPWQTFDNSRSAKEWADFVREKVYEMEF